MQNNTVSIFNNTNNLHSYLEFIFGSESFRKRYKKSSIIKKIGDISKTVVVIISKYKVEQKTMRFISSGILLHNNRRWIILTARHNVMRTTKIGNEELKLEEIRFHFPVSFSNFDNSPQTFQATRICIPNLPTKDRPAHNLKGCNSTWKHNSDFAFLEPCDTSFKIEHKYVSYPGITYSISVYVGEEIFVYGVPGITKKEDFNPICGTYEECENLFFPCELNISSGVITYVSDTLCYYDANAASGMSGGPVFVKRNNNLVLVGIHVGGLVEEEQNCFIPLSMQQLSDELRKSFLEAKVLDTDTCSIC